ncbi:MAG: hypothetical protein KDA42_10025 [Planctomycetales bacterium]|nr:hypothetical protein [Planctomycetales bacterium]
MKTKSTPLFTICLAAILAQGCQPSAKPEVESKQRPDEKAAPADETGHGQANEAEASKSETIDAADLAGLEDPEFDRFVDLTKVRSALQELDAGKLVELALRTAEGEQELKRERKGFSAASLLNVALRAASDSQDKEVIARIAEAAKSLGRDEMLPPIQIALKLADAPRKVEEGPKVPLRELSPEAMVLFRTFAKEIKVCRAIGDRKGLEDLRVTIIQLDELHERQKEYLTEKLIDGLAAVPAAPDASTAALSQLAGVPRRAKAASAASDAGE